MFHISIQSLDWIHAEAYINAEALFRFEIDFEESGSIIVNIFQTYNSNSWTESAHCSTDSIYSNAKNPILETPFTDDPLNKFHNQIILNVVGDIKSRHSVSKVLIY